MKCAVAAFLAMMSLVFAKHAPAAQPKPILVFGDSLSDGFMLKRSQAHPTLLPKKLRAAGLNLPDSSHPNAAGQKILAENVWRVLEPIAHEIAVIPSASEGPHR